MKSVLGKLFVAVLLVAGLSGFAQVESAIELMSDTAAWQNWPPDVGGPDEEDAIEETGLFFENPLDLGLRDFKDSLAVIPCYDLYDGFDMRSLFANTSEVKELFIDSDTLSFLLCREICDFTFPANGQMTSPFGHRWGRMHYGVDIDLETGDGVRAAFEGMVRISQYHPSYGNVVIIRHNSGIETLYAHLSQRKVVPGDYVQSGDLIGFGGNTGRSYGSHLHFEMRYLGQALDPGKVLDVTHQSLRDWEINITKESFHAPALEERVRGSNNRNNKYYIVKRGDTLASIARAKRMSVSKLLKLNKLKQSSKIKTGQKIKLK
jgi:murein DD-endopeptidase MepM/ murein hydrolase activator NlpD